MSWKEFFRPTIGKVLLFVLLLIVSILLSSFIWIGGEWLAVGFPFWFAQHFYGLTPNSGSYSDWQISYIGSILNIAIWYFVSCGIVILCHKNKK